MALVVLMAGGALFVATPSSAERTLSQVKDARPAPAKAVVRSRPSTQAIGSSSLGNARNSRPGAGATPAQMAVLASQDEPTLEPWSLIAGALAVMAFLARHRRTD